MALRQVAIGGACLFCPAIWAQSSRCWMRMRRANPGCNTQHRIPLHRLIERLGIAFPFSIGAGSEEYGHVAA